MASSQTTIVYQRANGLFAISSPVGDKRVSERALRAIGDQDINETVERAIEDPYVPQVITFRKPRVRFV